MQFKCYQQHHPMKTITPKLFSNDVFNKLSFDSNKKNGSYIFNVIGFLQWFIYVICGDYHVIYAIISQKIRNIYNLVKKF